jgi:tripartite-type tricarboxylate transporter receptor subunit TctC
MAGLLKEYGIDPTSVAWVPLQGAAPSLQELISGGVDFVIDSVPEGRSLLDAGRIRMVAVLGAERDANFPDVPTIEEAVGVGATGKPWNVGAWRGLVGPKDMPPEVVATLTAAIEKVYNSPEYTEFMGKQGLNMRWASGDEFAAFLKDRDESLGAVMKDVGLAQ